MLKKYKASTALSQGKTLLTWLKARLLLSAEAILKKALKSNKRCLFFEKDVPFE